MTATEQLAELASKVAAAKGRARDLANNAQAAKAQVDDVYNRLVEAHAQDDAAKVKAAKKAHVAAKAELEARVAEAQGAELRAHRAELAAAAFRRDNRDGLLADLEPAAAAAVEAFAGSLRAAVAHAAEIGQIGAQVNGLVDNPRGNCPSGHGFEPVVQAIEHALAAREPVSPMPHYRHTRFLEQQQREAEERARREAA